MPFLLRSDYGAQIKADLLNTIIDAQDHLRTDAELSAQAEVESYLRGRFDVARIFIDVQPWAAAGQYSAGAVVAHGTTPAPASLPVLYVATRATQGEQPGTEPPAPDDGSPAPEPAWELKDPRHALLKTYLIDCILYLLHSRQNPRAVPQIRQDRYDAAIAWLNLCRQGKISPGLPPLPDVAPDGKPNRESIRPRGGSLPKLSNSY